MAVALLVLCACGPRDAPGWRGTIDTLDNGAVLVRNPADGCGIPRPPGA